jgi:hypothetical protein
VVVKKSLTLMIDEQVIEMAKHLMTFGRQRPGSSGQRLPEHWRLMIRGLAIKRAWLRPPGKSMPRRVLFDLNVVVQSPQALCQ